MLRPTSWDDTPAAPIDHRLLLELMVLVDQQAHDRDDTGALERAQIRHRTEAEINWHLDHLAGLGLITARVVPGHPRRVCALSETGRAGGREHFDALLRGEG